MLDVLLFLGGVAIGIIVSILFNFLKTSYGVLKIDISDSEKEIYRICLDDLDDLDDLKKKKRIMLNVDSNADLSHE